jgi:hypothetical protein
MAFFILLDLVILKYICIFFLICRVICQCGQYHQEEECVSAGCVFNITDSSCESYYVNNCLNFPGSYCSNFSTGCDKNDACATNPECLIYNKSCVSKEVPYYCSYLPESFCNLENATEFPNLKAPCLFYGESCREAACNQLDNYPDLCEKGENCVLVNIEREEHCRRKDDINITSCSQLNSKFSCDRINIVGGKYCSWNKDSCEESTSNIFCLNQYTYNYTCAQIMKENEEGCSYLSGKCIVNNEECKDIEDRLRCDYSSWNKKFCFWDSTRRSCRSISPQKCEDINVCNKN